MSRRLNDLNSRQITHIHCQTGWQRNLGQTECAWVRVRGGSDDLEGREHRVAHIWGYGAETEIEVEEGCGMALEPAWLNGNGAALDRPFRAVGGGWHSAACTEVSNLIQNLIQCGQWITYKDTSIACHRDKS